jgi:16S rRNA (adenine1518-N6/adenine1519-N6)-dimethyltransferase
VARQKLGQHFLVDAGWREKIARKVLSPLQESSEHALGGVWIEIGAGHGEMTSLIAAQASRLIAIELDYKLLPELRALGERLGNVSVCSGDVLSLDLNELAGGAKFRVYGNIPYYITSPIVHHLLGHAEGLQSAFLVMQLEVAARLTARPGSRDYGYLSAFTQFYATSQILLKIPPGAFSPPPRVDSALVALRVPGERASLDVNDEAAFTEFLKACFARKRKTLLNNLRAVIPAGSDGVHLLDEARISRDARAEQIGLAEMAHLFALVQDNYSFRMSAARRSG